jgi:superfamily II DNA or RNA helicase
MTGFMPRLRLFTESVSVDADDIDTAVIELGFDYPPGTGRDYTAEGQARYLLESFGAVELECVEDIVTVPGSRADYLVHVDSDVHQLCAFGAYAIPQLRALGWQVDIDPDYMWQVVDEDGPWFAEVAAQEEAPDWFSLHLGVEIDGRRIDLLPALLDLVDGASTLRSLVRTSRRCIAVPVDDRRYLPLPPDTLRPVLDVLMELYGEQNTGKTEFHATRCAALAQLDGAFDQGIVWSGETAVREHARAIGSGPIPIVEAQAPSELRATLREYQQTGLSWLQHLRSHDAGGILADDMGLGKTVQTIAHVVAEHQSGRADLPVLIVAPTSVIGNWKRELRKFAPHLSVVLMHGPKRHADWPYVPVADVVITSFPLLVRDIERYQEQPFHMAILDEAQTIKNPRSRAHRASCNLNARHRLCLSGTPVENDLGELWALFSFLMPGMLGDLQTFRDRFQTPIERCGETTRLAVLRERVSPFILRRTKEGVAPELPPKTEIVRAVELSGKQRDLYESIRLSAHASVRRAIAKKGFGSSTIAILDALMKLRQVCCDPRLARVVAARGVRESAKYRMLFELLPQQLESGRRVLLFSQFTSMLELIGQGLRERDIGYVTLTGSTKNRQAVIDEFERRTVDVFLISLKAGGTGLNLTSADTVIHYDPWWNPAAQAQATDRAYRIGQTRPVFAYSLIAAGSVEERMLQLQRRKRQLADSILAPGGGVDLDEATVHDLFAPLPG